MTASVGLRIGWESLETKFFIFFIEFQTMVFGFGEESRKRVVGAANET